MALTDYVIMPSADYTAACDKVRERTGKTDPIKSGDLAAEIEAIPSGGGENQLEPYLMKTLTEANIPTIASLPASAFVSHTSLVNVNMPAVKSIGSSAFSGCSNLALTSLPAGITSIGGSAFRGCTKLALTSLPEGITSIAEDAFYSCSNLALTSLPEGVTSINKRAFYNCTKLALTSLPAGITTIPIDAFYYCHNLPLTSLPAGITSLGSSAFNECRKLALTSLPDGLTSIPDKCFRYCDNMSLTSLPAGLTSIGSFAFYNCKKVVLKTLPAALKTIGSYAFDGSGLKGSITFEGTPTSISSDGFGYNNRSIYIIRVPWAQGAVSGAPWGAKSATIFYDRDPNAPEITFKVGPQETEYKAQEGMTWWEFLYSDYNADGVFTTDSAGGITNANNRITVHVGTDGSSAQVMKLDTIIANHQYWNGEPLAWYDVSYNTPNCTIEPMPTRKAHGAKIESLIFANEGYNLGTITVTMGGVDISSTAINQQGNEAQLRIESVTGDVVVTITTTEAAEPTTYTVTVNLDSHLTHINYADSIASDNAEGYKDTYYLESGYVIDTVGVTIGGVEHNEYFHVTTNGGYTEIPMSSLTGDIVITLTTKGA